MVEQVATILMGQTFIDFAHGSPSTPTVDDFRITPKDNLGGRSWWLDTIGAVTARLNISAVDGAADHIFGWRLPFLEYAPAAGRYGILAVVKDLLLIEAAVTDFDSQLDIEIKAADNFINLALKRCGVTVPIVAPDDVILDISNYLAAGLHKQKDVPDEKVHSFWTIGINMLNEYISTNYPGEAGVPSITVPPEPATNQNIAYGVGLAT